jgi:hypothetical protein
MTTSSVSNLKLLIACQINLLDAPGIDLLTSVLFIESAINFGQQNLLGVSVFGQQSGKPTPYASEHPNTINLLIFF